MFPLILNYSQFSTSKSDKYGEIFHNFFGGQGKKFLRQNIHLYLAIMNKIYGMFMLELTKSNIFHFKIAFSPYLILNGVLFRPNVVNLSISENSHDQL